MKKLTSVVLSVLLVVSLFSCLLTGPVSAAESSGELITDGDFESEAINTSTGALGSLNGESINAFNADRSTYTGTWYRATNGLAPTKTPDLSVEATAPGTNEYPYYFGWNDQRVAEPGDANNHAMRAAQTLHQMVAVKENSSYTLSFRFRLPHEETGLSKLNIGLAEPTNDGTKITNNATPALPITSVKLSGTDGLGTYILPDTNTGMKGFVQLSFSTTNTGWQNVTLNFTTGSYYSGLSEAYGENHPIFLKFHFDISEEKVNDLTYTKQAIYYDDISLKETVDCVTAAEFYNTDGKIATPNDYAAVSLQVGGQPVLKAFAGEQSTATVDYDKESGAYRFLGWYKDGVKVSAEESITFTATAGEVYTPRFASTNILSSSASFEGLANGQNLLVDVPAEGSPAYPSGNRWGFNVNAGYFGQTRKEIIKDKNGTEYQQTGSGNLRTGFLVPTVVEDAAVAHSGSNYLKLNTGGAPSSLALENLTQDTHYKLSFYWRFADDNSTEGTLKGCGITTTVNIGNATLLGSKANITLANLVETAANPFNVTNNTDVKSVAATDRTWRQLTFTFNSGNFETLYLVFAPSDGKKPTVLLDDLVLTAKKTDSAVPVTFENTAGETINGSNEYALAEILDNFDGTSTATVDYDKESGAYAFKGWYNGDQRVSTEESFVFSNSAYPTLTPVVVSRNLLSNAGSFEQYNATTDLTVTRRDSGLTTAKGGKVYTADPPTGDKWGAWTNFTYPAGSSGGSYCGENYMNVQALSGAYTMTYYTAKDKSTTATETVTAHTGDNMLRIGFHSRSSIRALENLTPHTDYTLSFYTWGADPWNFILYASVATDYEGMQTNMTLLPDSGCERLAQYTEPTEKIDGYACLPAALVRSWRKITLNFNSGNHTTLYLHLGMQSTSTDSNKSASLLDDLTLVPTESTLPDSITGYLGTAIRTTGTQALRYKFSISKDIVKNGIAGYDLVEYGSIAIRTDYLGGAALTKDGVYNYGDMNRTPVVGVAYDKEAGKNIIFEETDTDYVFTAALTNIGVNKATGTTNYEAWGYDYSVRNYAVFKNTETGVLTTVYDETTAVASVFAVMEKIEADYEAADFPTEGELYDDRQAVQTILGEAESEQRRAYAAWKAQ